MLQGRYVGSCKTERQSFMAVILDVSCPQFHAK